MYKVEEEAECCQRHRLLAMPGEQVGTIQWKASSDWCGEDLSMHALAEQGKTP